MWLTRVANAGIILTLLITLGITLGRHRVLTALRLLTKVLSYILSRIALAVSNRARLVTLAKIGYGKSRVSNGHHLVT